jgi:glutamyl/glutaminyl-tRNA synthetase
VLTRVRTVERYANSIRYRVTVAEVCRSKPKLAEVRLVQTASNSARTSKRTHPVTITLVNF